MNKVAHIYSLDFCQLMFKRCLLVVSKTYKGDPIIQFFSTCLNLCSVESSAPDCDEIAQNYGVTD